jgi:hypothetical protein
MKPDGASCCGAARRRSSGLERRRFISYNTECMNRIYGHSLTTQTSPIASARPARRRQQTVVSAKGAAAAAALRALHVPSAARYDRLSGLVCRSRRPACRGTQKPVWADLDCGGSAPLWCRRCPLPMCCVQCYVKPQHSRTERRHQTAVSAKNAATAAALQVQPTPLPAHHDTSSAHVCQSRLPAPRASG